MQSSKKGEEFREEFRDFFRPKSAGEVLFTSCTKYYPDGNGGWYPVKRVTFDHPVFNPGRWERHKNELDLDDPQSLNVPGDPSENRFWKKSYNRARQACYDYMMCNPDLDTFLTFTVDPERADRYDYNDVVHHLSGWLDNRVRRNGLKYILVPERHQDGAFHFHGLANSSGLKLSESGYVKYGKYTLVPDLLTPRKLKEAQIIYNVRDLTLGWSTAILISGEAAQVKVSKYIWKYMTKQGGQKLGGRYYLHGGKLESPKLVYENRLFSECDLPDNVLVTYGASACMIETYPEPARGIPKIRI